MQESDSVIDEYTLAAFLAGTLEEERRQEVIEYLGANPDAREVLQMAAAALEAARSADDSEPAPAVLRKPIPARRSKPAQSRSRRPWHRGAGRYVAATLFVFVVGIVLRLTFGPPTDALRSPLQRSGTEFTIDVTAGPAFEWMTVENAYRYRLVVWDPIEARVAGQYETADSELDASDEIVKSLHDDLMNGRTYTLRIDAIDAQNRLVRSSETVEFVFE